MVGVAAPVPGVGVGVELPVPVPDWPLVPVPVPVVPGVELPEVPVVPGVAPPPCPVEPGVNWAADSPAVSTSATVTPRSRCLRIARPLAGPHNREARDVAASSFADAPSPPNFVGWWDSSSASSRRDIAGTSNQGGRTALTCAGVDPRSRRVRTGGRPRDGSALDRAHSPARQAHRKRKRPARFPGRAFLLQSGANRDRTGDLLNAIQALSQLSYSPVFCCWPPWVAARRRKWVPSTVSCSQGQELFAASVRFFQPSNAPRPLRLPSRYR